MTNDSLVSSIDDAIGSLELDICDIFGYVEDVDITETAFGLDNSGRLTKQLLRFPSDLQMDDDDRLGYEITDTGSSAVGAVRLRKRSGGTKLCFGYIDGTEFSIALDGTLAGTSVSTAGQGLVPASPGSASYFFNGIGTWSIPGQFTERVHVLNPTSDSDGTQTIPQGVDTRLFWPSEHYDTESIHDTTAAQSWKLVIPTTGKYSVFGWINVTNPSESDGNGTLQITIKRNGVTTIAATLQVLNVPSGYSTVHGIDTDYAFSASDTVEIGVLHTFVGKVSGVAEDVVLTQGSFGLARFE